MPRHFIHQNPTHVRYHHVRQAPAPRTPMPQNTKQPPHTTGIRRIVPSTAPHPPLAYYTQQWQHNPTVQGRPRSLDCVHQPSSTLLSQSIASTHRPLLHRKRASTVVQMCCSRGRTSIWDRDEDETGHGPTETRWHEKRRLNNHEQTQYISVPRPRTFGLVSSCDRHGCVLDEDRG